MQAIVIIWFLLPSAIQAVILVLLVRRRLYRRGMYPFFSIYTAFSVLVTAPRLLLVRYPTQYAAFYWATEVIYGILAIVALNEVFGRIFFLDYEEHHWLRFALPTTVVVIITALFVWWRFAYEVSRGTHTGNLRALFLAFSFGVHSVQVVLTLLFLLLWWALVPGWNRYDYGVLVGFGISAAVTMSARIARFYAGLNGGETWYRYAPGVGYVLATAVWLHAFWPARTPKPQPLMRFRILLERVVHNNKVTKLIHDWLNRSR